MAQLIAFQLVSPASCFTGKWQQQQQQLRSSFAMVHLKVTALPIRVRTTVIRCRVPVEELSPKEAHHLRKKEEQKKLRKIRKERRARRRAEELAKIPRPNPALRKFERPLLNWNKPWKKRNVAAAWKTRNVAAAKRQTDETHQGLGADGTKRWVARRQSNLEAFPPPSKVVNSKPSQARIPAWSEFDAVYEEKMKKSADRITDGKIINNFADKTEEFGAGLKRRVTKVPGSSDEVRAEYKDSNSRTSTSYGTKEWYRGGVEKPNGSYDTNLLNKVDFVGTRRGVSTPLPHPALSKVRPKIGAGGSNGGEDNGGMMREVSSRGEGRLGVSADAQVNVEGVLAQEFDRNKEERPSFVSSPWKGEARTFTKKLDCSLQKEEEGAAWRRPAGTGGLMKGWDTEGKAVVQGADDAKQGRADLSEGKNFEEIQQSFRIAKSEGASGMPNTSAPTVLGKQALLERRGGENPRLVGGQEIEVSKFWDRRDMHLNEMYDKESLKNNFERSAAAKKFVGEERLVEDFQKKTARVIIGRRKGENIYLSTGDDDARSVKGLPRSDLDEGKQLEWLANQLNNLGRPDGVHLSRLMRSGGLKITDGRAVILVQRLGELGNWRCALQVVEWLNSRNHFPPIRSRHLFTTLLAVLGRSRRPIESLNVFNVMREHVATYPDMPAYRVIAVTLGQAGYMEELFELIQSLRRGLARDTKYLLMVPDQGRLIPDIVVYNAALNSCVPHKHWSCAVWILDELYKDKHLQPNSASYGLAIEVTVKAGKFDLAWKMLEKMELGGFHPNSSTYKALVEGLGHVRKADLAVEMVRQMEDRGIVAAPGVYCALANTLCMSGRWRDALLQVDRIINVSKRPIVETYTGLMKACKDAGHWRDAISVFDHMREVCAPNIGTYNIMIALYGSHNMYDEAKKLFDEIKTGRINSPKLYRHAPRLSRDSFTYDAMLGACAVSQKWEDIEVLFRQMLLQGLGLDCERHAWIVRRISDAGKDHLVADMFNHLRSLSAATSELYVLMINSCLRGGDQNKAFYFLEEMVHKDMRITIFHFQKFQGMALLLSEEDRLKFICKVEGLKVTSDFNFKKPGRLPSSYQQGYAIKPAKTLGTLSSALQESPNGMNTRELADRNLQSSGSLQGSYQSSATHILSPVGVSSLGRNNWSPKALDKDLGQLQTRLDDLESTKKLSDFSDWELAWKGSSHGQQISNKFQLSEQLTKENVWLAPP